MVTVNNILHLFGDTNVKNAIETTPPYLNDEEKKEIKNLISSENLKFMDLADYVENIDDGIIFIHHYEENIIKKNKKDVLKLLSIAAIVCEIILIKNPEEDITPIIDNLSKYDKLFKKTDWRQLMSLIVIIPAVLFISFSISKIIISKF